MSQSSRTYLFGGNNPWSPLDWKSSDDRVRGGSSYSELTCQPSDPVAKFHGNLDIKTLGGAGFASQGTSGDDRNWNLSGYEGLLLDIAKSDGKQYTLILKDELLPKSPNGREQSTISWEYDFRVKTSTSKDNGDNAVHVKWQEFKPTYRGREVKGSKPLDLKNIKRISFMMRSFFGTQEGDFSLSIISLSASTKAFNATPPKFIEQYQDDPSGKDMPWIPTSKQEVHDRYASASKAQQGWFEWLFGRCSGKNSTGT